MKLVLLALFAFGSMAHATQIVCSSADGSSTLVYDAEAGTMTFNKAYEANPGPARISSTSDGRTASGKGSFYVTFTYDLADGRNVEMLWESQESDVLRGIRQQPKHAELKRLERTLATFPICRWAD